MPSAALYCRSSKDRADLSIAAQRRELGSLAKARGLNVVAEFVDAVESGKDDDRPGFRALHHAVQSQRREWDHLLLIDTSRLARNIYVAEVFKHACQKHGVRIVYANLPESNPIMDMMLVQIMQAMDQMHSMTSKAKGLAGMRENVRQGFRAGGRAPLGYALEHIDTGTIREGVPVRKSRLVLAADAPMVGHYLSERAHGVPRARAGLLQMSPASKVGIEWNALTYAGHTVWNMHAEAGAGRKRRPRKEWVVQRDTHPALITDTEAETILRRLEAYAPARTRARESGYLLTGLLVTPEGTPYHGDRGAYRVKGRQIQAERVDKAVAAHVLKDLQSSGFVQMVTKAARGLRKPETDKPLREALASAEKRLAKIMGLVEQTDTPAPLLRQMEAVEAERARLAESLAIHEADVARRHALSQITEMEVRRLLVERAAQIEDANADDMRDALAGLLDRVEFDGDELRIHYRIGRDKMASPRGAEPIPVITAHRLAA